MSERTVTFSFSVNENILLSLHESRDNFLKELLFMAALMLYRKEKLSLGKAAELAGFTKLDFIYKLQQEAEPVFAYTAEEINEIFEDAAKLP